MLDYIAVSVPPDKWNLSEKILWYCMEAMTSGLSHVATVTLPCNIIELTSSVFR